MDGDGGRKRERKKGKKKECSMKRENNQAITPKLCRMRV
jgi:hypothetical protein